LRGRTAHQAFGGARTTDATDRAGRGRFLGERRRTSTKAISVLSRRLARAVGFGRTALEGKSRQAQDLHMSHSEIDAVRELLRSRPRPTGFAERRERLHGNGLWLPRAAPLRG